MTFNINNATFIINASGGIVVTRLTEENSAKIPVTGPYRRADAFLSPVFHSCGATLRELTLALQKYFLMPFSESYFCQQHADNYRKESLN